MNDYKPAYATVHTWMRPVTRRRLHAVQNRLQELYQEEFVKYGLGRITASTAIDWLIYETGLPGEHGSSVPWADNPWTAYNKARTEDVIKEDKQ